MTACGLTSRCTEPLPRVAVSELLDFSDTGFAARARFQQRSVILVVRSRKLVPRHLTRDQIVSAINRGKSVEQLLQRPAPDQLAWIELRPVSGGIELWRYEVFDDGCEDFLDLYSFSPVEDWPETPLDTFSDPTSAFAAAVDRFSADSERWVNQSMIQDEYRDDLAKRQQTNGEQDAPSNGG